ncbi:MAG: hypothetical protein AAB922_06760 [Patescibacteria group bacterium]|mgnify:CR=1 FL=1
MEKGFQFSNVTAVGTTKFIDSRFGVLNCVTANSSATGTLVLYDTTSGTPGTADTKIATIGGGALSPQTFRYNLRVKNGLVGVSSGTPELTVTFQ